MPERATQEDDAGRSGRTKLGCNTLRVEPCRRLSPNRIRLHHAAGVKSVVQSQSPPYTVSEIDPRGGHLRDPRVRSLTGVHSAASYAKHMSTGYVTWSGSRVSMPRKRIFENTPKMHWS